MTRAFALHLRRHVVGYLALTLALGGGGAYAAGTLAASDGSVIGCVSKTSGAMRVVKPGKRCPSGYTKLIFNQQGRKGDAGASGARGEPGANGKDGKDGGKGDPGAVVVARVRALGSVPIAEGGGETGIPLSGQNWTQAADELDQYAGYVMVSATGSCGSSPVTVTIRDNGNQIGDAIYGAPSPVPAPMRIVFTLYPALTERSFDTGAAQAHSLSATAKTTCTGGAVTLTQVVIDIVGVR